MIRVWSYTMIATLFLAFLLPGSSYCAMRTVVAEEFTGTWCDWCPSAMQGLHNLEEQIGERLAVVSYHVGDAFEVPGCTTRRDYYNIHGFPNVLFDGILEHFGGDTTPVDYMPDYAEREVIPSPITLNLTLITYDGATGQGTVRAEMYNETDSTVEGQLRYVATGDDLEYDWQDYDHLYFTALHLFPTAEGVAVAIDPGQTVVDVQDFLLPPDWRDRDCTVVAFVQNDETKEIYQGANLSQVTPIELVGFTVNISKDGVLLAWTTATEMENAGFRIYRVANSCEEILTHGLIPGAGTSAVPHHYTYLDHDVEPGATYLYKLSDVSLSGVECFHTPMQLTVPETWGVPTALFLDGVRPSPAVHEAELTFSLPGTGPVSLHIYDLAGRQIARLFAGEMEAGVHHIRWNLLDHENARVSPGLYFARLAGAGEQVTTRIVVMDWPG